MCGRRAVNRDARDKACHVRDACNVSPQQPKNRRACTDAAAAAAAAAAWTNNGNAMTNIHASAAANAVNVMTCIVLKKRHALI